MNDKYIMVDGIQYKIVDESWEDRAAEVYHTDYVVYRKTAERWERFSPKTCYETTYHEAEAQIPGLYVQEKCPTCGHWETKRSIP